MTPAKEHNGPEPRGFGEHTRGLSGEYAHEQGWGLAVEERTKGPRNADGGNDYDYGARDFGDEAMNVASESARVTTTEEEVAMRMSNKEMEELKQHEDTAEAAPIPEAEDGGRARSHAAHLGGAVHENTKPAGGLKHGVTLGELREPPSLTSRVGKEHRKQ